MKKYIKHTMFLRMECQKIYLVKMDKGGKIQNMAYGANGQGAYNGSGVRGEYNLLGRDYSGNIINNYYFPVDALPETTPENWWYYPNPRC